MRSTLELRVKNWERFQHYKDRSPPWIKLYNELLDDYQFARLQDASKLHLVMIWLLASRLQDRVPADPEWIAKKINATDPVDLDVLVSAGFIALYDPIADRYHDASTTLALARASEEAEAETEYTPSVVSPRPDEPEEASPPPEREARQEKKRRSPKKPHRIPDDWTPTESHAEKAKAERVELEREAEMFRSHHAAKGTTYLDWDRAFHTWLMRARDFGRTGNNPQQHWAESL